MTTINQAFGYWLQNTAAITAQVSTRSYPAGDIQETASLPFIVWQKIDADHIRHQGSGTSLSGNAGLCATRFQVDCYAASAKGADDVFHALRGALNGFSGDMGESGSTVDVKVASIDTERGDFEMATDASARGPHRVSSDWIIWHAE